MGGVTLAQGLMEIQREILIPWSGKAHTAIISCLPARRQQQRLDYKDEIMKAGFVGFNPKHSTWFYGF